MDTKIRDYKGEIILQLEKLNNLNKELSISSEFEDVYNQAKNLLSRVNPSLMFYGVYNSGKSSLLNAIFGEMKASVADVPETHKVTYYKWRSFDLVDTPGVNGPIEDFVISKPELKKHNVIMFVIDDSDTFDSDFVAKEIVEIIATGKPLIIVLNNKQNSDEERFNIIRNKLYENISKAAKQQSMINIEQKYEFIVVNANMAYKGKIESKQLLVKASKIEELEIMITEQLRLIDEIRIVLNPLEIILNSVKELSKLLKDKMDKSDQQYLMNLLQEIAEKKNNVLDNLQTLIRMEIRRYNELIYSSVITGKDVDNLQQELSDKINGYISREVQAFSSECNIEFTTLISKPEIQLMINKISTDNVETNFKDRIRSTSSDINTESLDNLLNVISVLPTKPIPLPLPTPIPIPVPIIVAVVKGIISIFKNEKSNHQDLEEMQAQIEATNVQQREAVNRRMNAMQEARTQINIQLHKFEEDALKVAKENIAQIYDQSTQQINNLMVTTDKKLQEFSAANTDISKIEMELISVKNELKR